MNDSENCDQYELKPGFCSYCHQTFVQEEKQKRFIYDKLPIYVKKIVTEEANTDEDFNNNNVCLLNFFSINLNFHLFSFFLMRGLANQKI